MAELKLLRISYWIGAVLDVILATMMIVPSIFGIVSGIPSFNPGTEYQYAGIMAGIMVLGWAVLLIWADRDPVARKDVLLITVVPVLAGLIINNFLGLASGFIPLLATAMYVGIEGFLVLLFLFSYYKANSDIGQST